MSEQTIVPAEIIAECQAAIGRSRENEDSLAPEAADKLAILLGETELGDFLPPTYHWAYFNRGIGADDIGDDLHERTGIFLPAAPFNRRMWAAGELSILQPLRIGNTAIKRSTISDVAFKSGSSGQMCFVTVTHEIDQGGAPCIREKQTIVYRDRGAPEAALREANDPVPEGYQIYPDHQLFFYSAITHNGHRIHWDRDFCRETEGYPDLVVHGPMMATQLCEAMRNNELAPLRLKYRAQAPVFVTSPVRIIAGKEGMEREGRIERMDGIVSMSASLFLL